MIRRALLLAALPALSWAAQPTREKYYNCGDSMLQQTVTTIHLKDGRLVAIPAWIIYLLICVLLSAFILHRIWKKIRQDKLRNIAQGLGFSFLPENPELSPADFGDLGLFQVGHSARFFNVMRGVIEGGEVFLFDCRYMIGTALTALTRNSILADLIIGYRKNRAPTFYLTTIVAFRLRKGALPGFELRPGNIIDKIGSVFGYQGIEFPAYSRFSKKFLLRGRDERAVRQVFRPEALNFFEYETSDLNVEAGSGWLIAYKFAGRIPTAEITAFLQKAKKIAALLIPGGGAAGTEPRSSSPSS